jgi:hypothetical protein
MRLVGDAKDIVARMSPFLPTILFRSRTGDWNKERRTTRAWCTRIGIDVGLARYFIGLKHIDFIGLKHIQK